MLTEKGLGDRLKNVRKMRNISQFRMADMMGTEQSFIAKLEKGASYPKVSTLYRYAECVGLTLSDILAESPPGEKRHAVAGRDRREHQEMECAAGHEYQWACRKGGIIAQ